MEIHSRGMSCPLGIHFGDNNRTQIRRGGGGGVNGTRIDIHGIFPFHGSLRVHAASALPVLEKQKTDRKARKTEKRGQKMTNYSIIRAFEGLKKLVKKVRK